MGGVDVAITYLNPTAKARIKAQEEFVCEECGNCCTTCYPISVTQKDITRLAEYFKKSEKVIFRRHCKLGSSLNTVVFKQDRPCKFYDMREKKCKIYEARPSVCRMHPFLSSEPVWYDGVFTVPEFCNAAVKVYEKMKVRGEVG
jgi:hypothetical protein